MLSDKELRLPGRVVDGLRQILIGLESGQYVHLQNPGDSCPDDKRPFNMITWGSSEGDEECGFAACMGGWLERIVPDIHIIPMLMDHAEQLSGYRAPSESPLYQLFMATAHYERLQDIKPETAAKALRRYLETGRGDWGGL